jgi:DHA1 family multidrug resistance protein-like MFS transporter
MRLMLLRANFAGAAVVALMGAAQHVEQLVALRLLQGVFTGTMTAAQAMVSVCTPIEHSGFTLGALSAAVFSGGMAGSFLGGVLAHVAGYRVTFLAGGAVLLVAGFLVYVGTTEYRPGHGEPPAFPAVRPARAIPAAAFPILAVIGLIAFVRQFDAAFVPLLVQDIHGSMKGVSLWTGSLAAVGGVAGLLAGPVFGRLADRFHPVSVARASALAAGLFMAPQALVHGVAMLFPLRFGSMLFSGGLDPVFQVWLSRVTPEERRGSIFGWSGAARSIGWVIAPLASGWVASAWGTRLVFAASALLFLALVPAVSVTTRGLRAPRSTI